MTNLLEGVTLREKLQMAGTVLVLVGFVAGIVAFGFRYYYGTAADLAAARDRQTALLEQATEFRSYVRELVEDARDSRAKLEQRLSEVEKYAIRTEVQDSAVRTRIDDLSEQIEQLEKFMRGQFDGRQQFERRPQKPSDL